IIGYLALDPQPHTIEVRAERNLAVQGLLRSATGVLSNVSAVAPRAANDDNADRLQVIVNPIGEGPASTVRIVSLAEAGDILLVSGIDDAGTRAPGQVLELDGRGTIMLSAADLEQGSGDPRLIPGFAGPFGDGAGRWQVTVSASGYLSSSHIEAQSLVTTPDGSLANLSAVAPQRSRFEAEVWTFNPASNEGQRSVLRVVNREDRDGTVLIAGFDDAGDPAPAGGALLALPANAAVELSAADLEQGNAAKGLLGRLGDGTGKWRLSLSADVAILAQSLIESQQGGLTNISLPVR
ncbi:MAG: hypothetical protein U1A22_10080, partial [Xanthomonadaceae bacterium]|nr:hypothetical protein [Xanthomonadaceae bacterium]